MKTEKVNKYFGTTVSDWISRIPAELDIDAVGLWQLVSSGRDGFDLDGSELQEFVKRGILSLLNAGAVPVKASSSDGVFWEKQLRYGVCAEEMANNIIEEWLGSGVDPDHDGVWFSLFYS